MPEIVLALRSSHCQYVDRTHTHLILFNRYSYVGEAITRLFSLCCEKPLKIDDLGKFEFNTAAANEESPPHDRPVIVINANVGELAKVRAWPESKFSELISVLSDRLPEFQIVLIGKGADEFQTCANLANQPFRNANVQNLANTLSLDALIELITQSPPYRNSRHKHPSSRITDSNTDCRALWSNTRSDVLATCQGLEEAFDIHLSLLPSLRPPLARPPLRGKQYLHERNFRSRSGASCVRTSRRRRLAADDRNKSEQPRNNA